MTDFTVHRYGTDSSGRGIWLTVYMHDWFETVVAELGFRPTIIQGAFMLRNGGGAHDSSGYHDAGGCMDLRTRDLTTAQVDALVRVTREHGAASWRRDLTARHGGMDPHCHLTLGTDYPLSSGALVSWNSYLAGGDGIAGPGADYEWRPDPLVLTPPPEDDMPEYLKWSDEDRKALAGDVAKATVDLLLKAPLTKAGDTVKKALRVAAGLPKDEL